MIDLDLKTHSIIMEHAGVQWMIPKDRYLGLVYSRPEWEDDELLMWLKKNAYEFAVKLIKSHEECQVKFTDRLTQENKMTEDREKFSVVE
jgi:hypothetical protein